MQAGPRFFVLEPDRKGPHDTDCGSEPPLRTGQGPRCPECGEPTGVPELLPPFRMELEVYGQGPGDYATSSRGDRLVSERFVDMFLLDQLTGVLRFEPVEIARVFRKQAGRKIGPVTAYFLMLPTFGPGAVDEGRSRLRRTDPIECTGCRRGHLDGVYGFRIDPGTWNGEDVFRPRGFPAELVVSERFSSWVVKHAITNVKLVPTEEFWWDPFQMGPPAPTSLP